MCNNCRCLPIYYRDDFYGYDDSTCCGTGGLTSYNIWAYRYFSTSFGLPTAPVTTVLNTSGLNNLTAQIGWIFKTDGSVTYYPGYGLHSISLYLN